MRKLFLVFFFTSSAFARSTTTLFVPCCKCLGDPVTTLNLNTGQASPIDSIWTVNNGGDAHTTSPSTAWTVSLPGANWIQPVAGSSPVGTGPGPFHYRVLISVPECALQATVSLTGQFASDNDGTVFFDTLPLASCGTSCFATSGGGPVSFSVPSIAPGLHVLDFQVLNQDQSISGLIVSASITRQCARCDRCPLLGKFDGANCYIGQPPNCTNAFIFSNAFYYTPLPGNQCPFPGSWFDGANCFVTTIPSGATPFIYNNAWYVTAQRCDATQRPRIK